MRYTLRLPRRIRRMVNCTENKKVHQGRFQRDSWRHIPYCLGDVLFCWRREGDQCNKINSCFDRLHKKDMGDHNQEGISLNHPQSQF